MCRHFTVRVLLAAVVGLVTTVIVAWLAALFPGTYGTAGATLASGPIVGQRELALPERGIIIRLDFFASTWLRLVPPAEMPQVAASHRAEFEVFQAFAALEREPDWRLFTPSWAVKYARRILYSAPIPQSHAHACTFDAYGWPCRALLLESEFHYDPVNSAKVSMRGAFPIPHSRNAELQVSRGYGIALPYLPIWPGLLANTAIFAAPWAVILFGIPFVRYIIRRARNRCTRCGYSLHGLPAGSPCPECGGAARPSRR